MVVWDSSAPILEVVVSRNPATIHGKVTASVGEAAVGAPVYLERWDEREGKRLGEIRRTLTGAQGGFSFRGLGPGAYRLVSSFDFDAPGEELMPNVQPKLVRVAEGENAEADLALFVMQKAPGRVRRAALRLRNSFIAAATQPLCHRVSQCDNPGNSSACRYWRAWNAQQPNAAGLSPGRHIFRGSAPSGTSETPGRPPGQHVPKAFLLLGPLRCHACPRFDRAL
jgi:hypothetical protein